MAFVSCYFMGAACRGGTVDACFVHNVTYICLFDLSCILYFALCMVVIQLVELQINTFLSLSLSLS